MVRHSGIKMFLLSLALMVSVTLIGCGGDGSTPAPASMITVSLQDPNTTYLQQQVASLTVTNFTITDKTYSGSIDGMAVKLARVGNGSLAFAVPTLADGSHTLRLSLGGQSQSVAFNTKLGTVQELSTVIDNITPGLLASLNELRADMVSEGASQSLLNEVDDLKANLNNAKSQTATLSDADKEALAAFFANNIMVNNVGQEAIQNTLMTGETQCGIAQNAASAAYPVVATDAAVLATTYWATIGAPETFDASFKTAATVFAGAQFLPALAKLSRHGLRNYVAYCTAPSDIIDVLTETNAVLSVAGLKKKTLMSTQSGGTYSFSDNEAKTFTIKTTYAYSDAFLTAAIGQIKDWVAVFPSALVPADTLSWAGTIDTPLTEDPPATAFRIQSISDVNIQGTLTPCGNNPAIPCGNNLSLKFTFTNMPASSPVPFSFTLVDLEDLHTSTFSATLDNRRAINLVCTGTQEVTASNIAVNRPTDASITVNPSNGTIQGVVTTWSLSFVCASGGVDIIYSYPNNILNVSGTIDPSGNASFAFAGDVNKFTGTLLTQGGLYRLNAVEEYSAASPPCPEIHYKYTLQCISQ